VDTKSIARPYAKAIFEYACQSNQLVNYSTVLSVLAKTIADARVLTLLKNPQLDAKEFSKILIDILQQNFCDDALKNLINLLAEKQRLIILPELFELFESHRTAYEKTIKTQIVSAYPISIEQQEKLATALKIRLRRNVTIQTEVEPALLGGAIIKVEDLNLVIDGSVKNTLARLLTNLSAP